MSFALLPTGKIVEQARGNLCDFGQSHGSLINTMDMGMQIEFPIEAPLVYTPDKNVGFKAIVNRVLHQCEISEKALKDQFDAASGGPADLFAAFDSGRTEIEMITRRKIETQGLKGRILITNGDF